MMGQILMNIENTGTLDNIGDVGITGDVDVTGNVEFVGTLTCDSLQLTTDVVVTAILDEDDMASDSEVAIPTQQSVKAYVDAVENSFGSWVDKSSDYGAQQASTDGFVIGITIGGSDREYVGYSDSSSNPTTVRAYLSTFPDGSEKGSFMFPVKKNDYWKITFSGGSGTLTAYWMPMGS